MLIMLKWLHFALLRFFVLFLVNILDSAQLNFNQRACVVIVILIQTQRVFVLWKLSDLNWRWEVFKLNHILFQGTKQLSVGKESNLFDWIRILIGTLTWVFYFLRTQLDNRVISLIDLVNFQLLIFVKEHSFGTYLYLIVIKRIFLILKS